MKKLILTLLISSAFLLACTKGGEQKTSSSPVLAKVGSSSITQEDVNREVKGLPQQIRGMFAGQEGIEKFVEELVKKELLFQEAKKKGMDNDAEYLKRVEDFKKITLIRTLLEKEIEEKAKVNDKDVKDYYEAHKNEFAANNQIKASHILVKTEEEAKKIAEELKKGGNFAKLAKERSLDKGSAKNGGDLGSFSRGQMVPEFEAAAFSLKKGEISSPVKTQYGYHIIKVTDRKEGSALPFEKVKDMLTQKVTSEKQKEVFDSYVKELRASYKVEINKDAVAKMAAEGAPDVKGAKPGPDAGQKPEGKK